MKKLLILILVSSSLLATAQVPQYNATWYNFRLSIIDSLGVPRDTFPVPNSLKGRPWLGTKGDNAYMWSTAQQKYIPIGSGGTVGVTSVNASASGALSVSGVPFTTSGTIGLNWTGLGSDYVKGNGAVSNFSNDVQAVGNVKYALKFHTHLFSQLSDGVSAVRNLFSGGAGLSYNPATGVFSALDTLDPANYALITQLNDSMTKVRDSLTAIASRIGTGGSGITQAQLDDTAAAIRADMGSSGTPTLQQVTTAGSSTDAIIDAYGLRVNNATVGQTIQLTSVDFGGSNVGGMIEMRSANGTANTLQLKSTGLTTNRTLWFPNKDGTLATLDDITGGGGSATPAGNYGNIQINRNGAFSTPSSDSLNFSGGLIAKGTTKMPSYITYNMEEVGTLSGWQPYFATDGTVMSRTAGTTKITNKTHANDGANIAPNDGTVLVDASGGATSLVPNYYNTEAGSTGGKLTIKKMDSSSNAVTLDFSWGYPCDGATSKTLTAQYQYITVQFTGTQWVVVGGN